MDVNSPLGYERIQGCMAKVMVRNAECALFSGTCLAALVLKLERQNDQFLQKYSESTGWQGGQQAKITWNHPENSFQEMTHNLFEELGANLPPREPLPSLKEHPLRKTAPKGPSFIALGARLARVQPEMVHETQSVARRETVPDQVSPIRHTPLKSQKQPLFSRDYRYWIVALKLFPYSQWLLGRYGEGNGNPLQYSRLENPVGWRSPVGCSPRGCQESDTTERLHFLFSLLCIGEGNGNPLQCSCLENPRDEGAQWAAVYGVTQSQTQLKRLSHSSS